MRNDLLLIKIKALDLLIDEVNENIQLSDTLMEMDACWEADKAASLLQDYLEILAKAIGAPK